MPVMQQRQERPALHGHGCWMRGRKSAREASQSMLPCHDLTRHTMLWCCWTLPATRDFVPNMIAGAQLCAESSLFHQHHCVVPLACFPCRSINICFSLANSGMRLE